jgi:hypothetical protein
LRRTNKKDNERTEDKRLSRKIRLLLDLALKEDEAVDKERPEDKRRIREMLASLGTYS